MHQLRGLVSAVLLSSSRAPGVDPTPHCCYQPFPPRGSGGKCELYSERLDLSLISSERANVSQASRALKCRAGLRKLGGCTTVPCTTAVGFKIMMPLTPLCSARREEAKKKTNRDKLGGHGSGIQKRNPQTAASAAREGMRGDSYKAQASMQEMINTLAVPGSHGRIRRSQTAMHCHAAWRLAHAMTMPKPLPMRGNSAHEKQQT
jgi:hypothetical protein